MVLESDANKDNCFLTCTYDDQHLPTGGTLVKKHYVDFMKRLRRRLGFPIRFKVVGEYGDEKGRPHYHFALFGYPHCPYYNFGDNNPTGDSCPCPTCQLVHLAWGMGKVDLAQLTKESAQYIAGYVTKKMTRDVSEFQKAYLNGRLPEFSQQSNGGRTKKGGIGAGIVDEYLLKSGGLLDENDDLISRIRVGNMLTHLPRSLKNRLRNKAGLTDEHRKDVYGRLQKKAMQELFAEIDYDTASTDEILKALPASFARRMVVESETSQKIRNLEEKHKIKQSKGKKL